MAFGSPASRKLLLTMVSLVVALDVVAIGLYYMFGIARRPNQLQTGFVVVWVLLPWGIPPVYMKRISQSPDPPSGRPRPAQR